MHELAIAESVLKIAVREAESRGATRVLEVRMRIGELSGVIPECLRECFGIASRGSLAEGASIEVSRIPASIRCRDCGYEGAIGRGSFVCPECGSAGFQLTGGREYFVDSLKIE